uniref:RNase H type-1 domain-containing protein n=1 Tax=Micrurus lemniscatus lemniscatus TaxID=129467 RepID=A0A2D4HXP4_MICLE
MILCISIVVPWARLHAARLQEPYRGSITLPESRQGQCRDQGMDPSQSEAVTPVLEVTGHDQGMWVQGTHPTDHHNRCKFSKLWSPLSEPNYSVTVVNINWLELRAIHLALRSFKSGIVGQHVLILMDNVTAKAHINRQGGTHSLALLQEAERLGRWAETHLSIRTEHISGVENIQADWLSRTTIGILLIF